MLLIIIIIFEQLEKLIVLLIISRYLKFSKIYSYLKIVFNFSKICTSYTCTEEILIILHNQVCNEWIKIIY